MSLSTRLATTAKDTSHVIHHVSRVSSGMLIEILKTQPGTEWYHTLQMTDLLMHAVSHSQILHSKQHTSGKNAIIEVAAGTLRGF